MWRIELSGDGKPVWLTPHPRDLIQPGGETERESSLATNGEKADGHQSRLQFETVNKYILMLTVAIPDNGL